jgi:hypothetical protein
MPYLEIAIAAVFATAFAKGGKMEARNGRADHGLLWVAASVAVSALVVAGLGLGVVWLIGAQLLLFVAIAAMRVMLETRERV